MRRVRATACAHCGFADAQPGMFCSQCGAAAGSGRDCADRESKLPLARAGQPQIKRAVYGKDGVYIDVTAKLQQSVCERFRGSLPLEIADSKNGMWGDPLRGAAKEVIVDWVFDGNERRNSFGENTPIILDLVVTHKADDAWLVVGPLVAKPCLPSPPRAGEVGKGDPASRDTCAGTQSQPLDGGVRETSPAQSAVDYADIPTGIPVRLEDTVLVPGCVRNPPDECLQPTTGTTSSTHSTAATLKPAAQIAQPVGHGPVRPGPSSSAVHAADARAINWFTLRSASLEISDASVAVFSQAASAAVNVVAVCGELRTGKSYLLNALSGSRVFGVSAAPTPCTKGVEMSPILFEATELPLARPKVVYADMEGHGDKGMAYDMHLITPLLLISKIVILNVVCPTGPSKESVLNRLHLIMHAAKQCAAHDDREHLFGNLHVVLRDCPHSDDVCWAIIFSPEDPACAETAAEGRSISDRNEIRRAIRVCFESVPRVWCLPKMAASHAPLDYADAPPGYAHKVDEMRAAMQEQLIEPKYVDGQALSGGFINRLLQARTRAAHMRLSRS
jgi:hypothetical protein